MAHDDAASIAVTDWNGRPNYGCRLCPRQSLDRARIVKHVNLDHGAPAIEAGQTDTVGPDLEGLTKFELRSRAEAAGIEVASSATKADIVKALEEGKS